MCPDRVIDRFPKTPPRPTTLQEFNAVDTRSAIIPLGRPAVGYLARATPAPQDKLDSKQAKACTLLDFEPLPLHSICIQTVLI
jgi:hypothetical protein